MDFILSVWLMGYRKSSKFFQISLGPKSENFLGRKSYLGMEGKISYHDHNFSRSSFQRLKSSSIDSARRALQNTTVVCSKLSQNPKTLPKQLPKVQDAMHSMALQAVSLGLLVSLSSSILMLPPKSDSGNHSSGMCAMDNLSLRPPISPANLGARTWEELATTHLMEWLPEQKTGIVDIICIHISISSSFIISNDPNIHHPDPNV